MRICYVPRRFSSGSMSLIETANEICRDYARQGYDLTLRQLYYQFVAKGLIPNKQTEYKRLGSVINDARLAGLLDWNYIKDRGRNVRGNLAGHKETPEELIQNAAESYFEDLWADQDRRIEVWVEKEALADVVRRAASGYRCASFPCKGYVSQSEMWAAGRRIEGYVDEGKDPLILHLGDHDPSGIDMTRDIRDRLTLFAGFDVEVRRIALNMDQIERYDPPPNPAKLTDSRSSDYVMNYGDESWELDALDPATLNTLITNEIEAELDHDVWIASVGREEEVRASIVAVAEHWAEISEQFGP